MTKEQNMSDWQPIETAPRDGTWLLLTGEGHVGAGLWLFGEWRDLGDIGWGGMTEPTITHWMPLPEPPQ